MRSPGSGSRKRCAPAVLAGCAALVTACGAAGGTAGSPPSATTATMTPAATSSPAPAVSTVPPTSGPPATAAGTPAGPPPCPTSALRAAVDTSRGGAAAGSIYYPVQFTNGSGTSCTLYGYPGVSLVTAVGGSQIGIPATENPAHPRQLVTLAPGQTAHADLQVVDAENYPAAACGLVTAHWLKVYPPNQTAPLYAAFTTQTCSKPKAILTVQTVQPGSSGA